MKIRTTLKGIMIALVIFCSASVVLAVQPYQVNWPTDQGATHSGIIIPDAATTGQHLIGDIDLTTGDLYVYQIYGSDGSPGNVRYTDGSVAPAFMYGKKVGSDPVTAYTIYDVYVSGSGVGGTFAYCCTISM